MVKVIMTSDVYGREEFDYDNLECAEKAMKRLVKKSRSLNDDINRRFEIIEDTGNTVICGVPDFAKRFTKKNEQEKALTFLNKGIKRHVKEGGIDCVYCGSDHLILEDPTMDDEDDVNELHQDVTCEMCGEKWTDVYKLVDVRL